MHVGASLRDFHHAFDVATGLSKGNTDVAEAMIGWLSRRSQTFLSQHHTSTATLALAQALYDRGTLGYTEAVEIMTSSYMRRI